MVLLGPDISSYQGFPNMAAVAGAGNDLCIIKATESTNYINPNFNATRLAAHQAGMVVGLYHFARAGNAQAEADFFLRVVGDLADGEFLVLDWEVPAGDPPGWCLAWLNAVHAATGLKPWIYMNQSACSGSNWSAVVAGDYALWLAKYDGDPWTQPSVPWWGAPAAKQYTDAASIPGVPGNCDRSAFYGDRAQLLAYCKGGQPPPAPPRVLGDDMRVARDPNGTVWLVTDLSVLPIQDPTLSGAAQKVWGDVVDVSMDEINALSADAGKRQMQLGVTKLVQPLPFSDREGGHTADSDDLFGQILSSRAELHDLSATVTALAQKAETGGVDPARLQAIMTQAVTDALKNIKVVTAAPSASADDRNG